MSFLQVMRLFPEVKWVNSLQSGNIDADVRQPTMLLPVAVILRDNLGETMITPSSLRSILDSVGNRLDEAKDTSRYLTGLLVFLGLLGTFYGLLQTVSSVGDVIQSLDITAGDSGNLFTNLKDGLEAPLSGMGTAFASSLFGLSGSLILGFLDLQASQAQNAFFTDLEDWMSSMTELDHPMTQMQVDQMGVDGAGMQEMVAQLGATMQNSSSSQNAIRAMAELAHGLDGLTKLIRTQQDDLRTHITDQAANNQKKCANWWMHSSTVLSTKMARTSQNLARANNIWRAQDGRHGKTIGPASWMPWPACYWSSSFFCQCSCWRSFSSAKRFWAKIVR